MKDRRRNYGYPKGRLNIGEDAVNGAIREVWSRYISFIWNDLLAIFQTSEETKIDAKIIDKHLSKTAPIIRSVYFENLNISHEHAYFVCKMNKKPKMEEVDEIEVDVSWLIVRVDRYLTYCYREPNGSRFSNYHVVIIAHVLQQGIDNTQVISCSAASPNSRKPPSPSNYSILW